VGNVEDPGEGSTFTYDSTIPTITIVSVNPAVIGEGQNSCVTWVVDYDGAACVELGGDGTPGSGDPLAEVDVLANVSVNMVIGEDILPTDNTSTIYIIVDTVEDRRGVQSFLLSSDRAAPLAGVLSPADNTTLLSLSAIRGNAADVGAAGVALVEVSLFDGEWFYNGSAFSSANAVFLEAEGAASWTLDTSLVPWQQGRYYSARCRAVDAVGNVGDESAGAGSTFVFGTPAIPNAPENLTIIGRAGMRVELAWKDMSINERGFRIYRSRDQSEKGGVVRTIGINVTSITDTGLEHGKLYCYRVYSYNLSGESEEYTAGSVKIMKKSSGCQVGESGMPGLLPLLIFALLLTGIMLFRRRFSRYC
jgi:hypothetical protein